MHNSGEWLPRHALFSRITVIPTDKLAHSKLAHTEDDNYFMIWTDLKIPISKVAFPKKYNR